MAAIRGDDPVLPVKKASRQIDLLSRAFQLLDVTPMIVLEASRGVSEHQLSYWDSQIWAAARLNRIPVVLTEAFQHGASIEGVRFVDPFATKLPVSQLA